MTNATIFLVRIAKLNDYGADTYIALEAFSTLDKAKAFLTDRGMVELSYDMWVSPESDIEGDISALEVK